MAFRIHLLILIGLWLSWPGSASAGQQFAVVCFHNVVDDQKDLDEEGVTTDRLMAFFEWLKANHWHAISIDDLDAAQQGRKPLPEHSILLTFDDGERSGYTRVYPLLLAYRFPAVFAITGSWMDAPMDSTVDYGGEPVPRSKFLSWEEAREMAGSGLVEFASHTYALHYKFPANPQGSELPAAWTRIYRPGLGYATEAEFRQRLAADFKKSRDLMGARLGRKPRVLIWPYGRYNETGMDVARQAGFEYAFTLDSEPADLDRPMALGRILVTGNPKIGEMAESLEFRTSLPAAHRLVALDPAALWTGDEKTSDDRLGRTIERLRTLGANGVVLDAAVTGADGRLTATWFPNGQLPVKADFLSRIAWQCWSRAGTEVYVRLPATAALRTLGDPEKVRRLFSDLGAFVPVTGMFVDDAPGLAQVRSSQPSTGAPWEVRKARNALRGQLAAGPEALALSAFREVKISRPGLLLIVLANGTLPPLPSAIADLTLVPVAPNPRDVARLAGKLGALGWLTPNEARRGGLWFTGDRPPEAARLEAATREFQRQGGTAIGWAADDPMADLPRAAVAGRSVSSAIFPVKY